MDGAYILFVSIFMVLVIHIFTGILTGVKQRKREREWQERINRIDRETTKKPEVNPA